MTTRSTQELVERIHASDHGCVLSLTGGASGVVADLLEVPGASATVLEVLVPYAASSLEAWLGGKFDQACSEPTARAMAMAGFERARRLSTADPRSLRGIGATASLATVRPKRGPHRVHAAWQSAGATVSYSCELVKGRRSRAEEEVIAAGLVLHAVAEACGIVTERPAAPSADELIFRREQLAPLAWSELLLGERDTVSCGAADSPRLIMSGAFNPPHVGHQRMAELASARCGMPVVMELSIANVDKPPLDFIELDERLRLLAPHPVLMTRAPTFVEKAALVPGATFVVGADTIARIADERYYDDSLANRDSALALLAARGCRFLVFGRVVDGRFVLPSDMNLPSQLRGMCDEVRESEFRYDISSSALRAKSP